MQTSTTALVLTPDTPIDLQMHTTLSDGTWLPAQLLDYVANEKFGLIAITDHERVDTAAHLQHLALQKHVPLLTAAEISASWKGQPTDVLCFGFSLESSALHDITQDIVERQCANIREVCDNLQRKGLIALDSLTLAELVQKPSTQQPHEIIRLLKEQKKDISDSAIGPILKEAGFSLAMADIADVVNAAHQSDGVLLIAHPGRGNGYVQFDHNLLDELRRDVPIDGLEVYYPAHTPEQAAMFLAYAEKHDLLVSSGSDSHGPQNKPIKYPARLSRALLEHLGIQIKATNESAS